MQNDTDHPPVKIVINTSTGHNNKTILRVHSIKQIVKGPKHNVKLFCTCKNDSLYTPSLHHLLTKKKNKQKYGFPRFEQTQ